MINIMSMKSLEAKFKREEKKNPLWSSYTQFAEAIKNQTFTKRTVTHWFNELVDKEDYRKEDKQEILQDLFTRLKTR